MDPEATILLSKEISIVKTESLWLYYWIILSEIKSKIKTFLSKLPRINNYLS